MSNLKLQKLCFYAQGLLTAMRGRPLFSDTIEAWDHGPVVPNLYHEFKQFGSIPIDIPENVDECSIEPGDRVALSDVLSHYDQFSPWRLRNMTHEERPWIEAHQSGYRLISVDSLVEHFRPQIDDAYVARVYGNEAVDQAA